jgi:hypothetical protein
MIFQLIPTSIYTIIITVMVLRPSWITRPFDKMVLAMLATAIRHNAEKVNAKE